MAKYYNAEELLEFVKQNTPHIDGETTTQCVERAIKNAPTADVVEVVRCKNCESFIEKGNEFLRNDVFGFCEKSRTGFFDDGEEVYGNDFCSYGERKENK